MRTALVLLAFSTLAAPAARAQSLRATVDRTEVTSSERFALTLTVTGGQEAVPQLPNLPDFEIRQAGTSTQFQIVNGKSSSSISYSYLLFPKKQGTFVIPPATLEVNGAKIESQPITVRVVAETAQPERERDLFITASVSNPKPFQGEQIVYSWRLHHRVRLTNARLDPFDLSGFQAEDLGDAREFETTVDGQLYRVHEIKKALFPQQAGLLRITGPAIECAVVLQRRGRGSMLDEMLGRFETELRRIKAPAVAVEVRPLPAAPSGFSGLVGQLRVDSSVSRAELSTGQSTTLKITVSGSGNARLIGEPKLAGLEPFKIYDEKPQQVVERNGDEVRGRKVFTKSLVPLRAGQLTLPGASLLYFDPKSERYETAAAPPITLVVEESAGQEDPRLTEALAPGGGKVSVTILADDILPIDKSLEAVRPARASGAAAVMTALLLPPLAWAGLYWRRRRHQRFAADRGLRRRLEALKKAQPLAQEAAQKWAQGAVAEAAALASRGLRQYIGDKVGVEGGALTADEAAEQLATRGMDAERVARVRGLLLELESQQYRAGAGDTLGTVDLLPLLNELERELSSKEKSRLLAALLLLASLALPGLDGTARADLLVPAGAEGPVEEVFVRANTAYEAGEYSRAAELYRALIGRGVGGGALFYNLGNAYLRTGELGQAVAAYRQAQALTPRSSDLAANLAFARQSAKDALPPPEPSKIASTLFFWHYRLSRHELAWVAVLANALLWLALCLRLLRGRTEGLTWAAWACGLVLVAAGSSLAVRSASPTQVAVIVPAEVEVKSSTDAKALTRFKLHAGSELRLEGRAGDWLRIELPDGEPGWIQHTDAAVVSW